MSPVGLRVSNEHLTSRRDRNTHINSNDIVISGEHAVACEDPLKRRGAHVEPQAAAVDCPCKGAGSGSKGKDLICLRGKVAHIERQVWYDALVGLVAAAGAGSDRGRARRVRRAARIVPYDAGDVVGPVDGRARGQPAGAEPVVACSGVGLDEHVDALSDGHQHAVGLVGHNGHKVGADDGEGVAVNGELEVSVNGHVDEPEAVRGAGLEDGLELGAQHAGAGRVRGGRAVVGVGAVDQAAIERGRGAEDGGGIPEVPDIRVVPVAEEECAKILVIVCGGRAVESLERVWFS